MNDNYILTSILNFEHNESNDVVEMFDGKEYTIVHHNIWKPMVDNIREALIYELNEVNTRTISAMNELQSMTNRYGYYGDRIKELTNEV